MKSFYFLFQFQNPLNCFSNSALKMLPVKLKKELQARDSSIIHSPQSLVHKSAVEILRV